MTLSVASAAWLFEGPGKAYGREIARPVGVRLVGVVGLLRDGRAVLRGDVADRVVERLYLGPGTDHEDRARPHAGADEDVSSVGRAMEEVPLPKRPFFLFDDERALAREDEESFLSALRVVESARLPRPDDMDVDSEVAEPRLP